jgi:hypothetical protein
MVLKMDGQIKNTRTECGSRTEALSVAPARFKGARGRVRGGQPPLTHLHRPTGRRDKATTILSSLPERQNKNKIKLLKNRGRAKPLRVYNDSGGGEAVVVKNARPVELGGTSSRPMIGIEEEGRREEGLWCAVVLLPCSSSFLDDGRRIYKKSGDPAAEPVRRVGLGRPWVYEL